MCVHVRQSLKGSILKIIGGKFFQAPDLEEITPEHWMEIYSPFGGALHYEQRMARRGVRVRAFDKYDNLVTFWWEASKHPVRLADYLELMLPHMDRELYDRLQNVIDTISDDMERAAATFIINRLSWSGLMQATRSYTTQGPILKHIANAIRRLREFRCPTLEVECADFRESIPQAQGKPLFLDPPYLMPRPSDNKLYGRNGELHKDFPHDELHRLLKNRDQFILTYGDHPHIRDLYRKFQIYQPKTWRSRIKATGVSREVVILSPDINLPEQHAHKYLKVA